MKQLCASYAKGLKIVFFHSAKHQSATTGALKCYSIINATQVMLQLTQQMNVTEQTLCLVRHYLFTGITTLKSKSVLDIRLKVLGNTCKCPEIAGRLDVRPNVLKFQDV